MSTKRQILVTDHRGNRLLVDHSIDGTISANCLDGVVVDLDEVDRQRLRDFLAGS